jgi:hypothetical protein
MPVTTGGRDPADGYRSRSGTRYFVVHYSSVEIHRTEITDELIEQLADEAEQGYDSDTILGRRGKRGRPALGSGPSTVESVRLDPELKTRLAERAEADGVPVSDVIREALRHHLDAAS